MKVKGCIFLVDHNTLCESELKLRRPVGIALFASTFSNCVDSVVAPPATGVPQR